MDCIVYLVLYLAFYYRARRVAAAAVGQVGKTGIAQTYDRFSYSTSQLLYSVLESAS